MEIFKQTKLALKTEDAKAEGMKVEEVTEQPTKIQEINEEPTSQLAKQYKWKKINYKTFLPKHNPIVAYIVAKTNNIQNH